MEQGLCRPSKKEPMVITAPRRTEKERRHTSLNRAYQQVNVYEEDVEETAIITPKGLFKFPRMCPGLKNANQTLQRYINQVLIGLDLIFPFIDDVLIASESEKQHSEHL
ncbi:hypothetical protein EVAR_34714_1 [Eumeta japonica]|uniref:Reverse transcriptase domain-containing protein n=1 Tax=Eumeta variegata TaxID=151549 RepID=A0A4C1XDH1_EUMVA|nr:hypothetical protein EVAR_34714_1 [Eumeta japonica]